MVVNIISYFIALILITFFQFVPILIAKSMPIMNIIIENVKFSLSYKGNL